MADQEQEETTGNESAGFCRKSAVKDYLASKKMRVSGEAYAALDSKIVKLLSDAAARAAGNGRATVKKDDL